MINYIYLREIPLDTAAGVRTDYILENKEHFQSVKNRYVSLWTRFMTLQCQLNLFFIIRSVASRLFSPISHYFVQHLLSQEAFAVGLILQPLPQRVSVGPVYINFTEQVKIGIVRLSKLLDLSFIAWFLVSKTREK